MANATCSPTAIAEAFIGKDAAKAFRDDYRHHVDTYLPHAASTAWISYTDAERLKFQSFLYGRGHDWLKYFPSPQKTLGEYHGRTYQKNQRPSRKLKKKETATRKRSLPGPAGAQRKRAKSATESGTGMGAFDDLDDLYAE
ncbi:hypothetical protein RHOSPDRAFT_34747 [Rhodotorula sp. JG-1b]|nr:hypothetical protein RHOSPDRAFT_34747 [Rhodotorula sp. JG-1b]